MLTERIAYLLTSRGVSPRQICAVTFTNKAAREMRQRVEAQLGERVGDMWLGTFHSIGVRMLRRDGAAIGIESDFVIYDEADRIVALRRALSTAGIDDKRFPPARVGHAISAAKNELQNAAMFASTAQGFADGVVAQIFASYERGLIDAHALDFDDLLVKTVALLRDVPEVREKYQRRFTHLFVDEYQDTNAAQYQMVLLLSAQHRNLTVVGDDDQSVFGWRGADVRNILSFERDFPDALVVTLEQNYRSSQVILDAAYGVIQHNTQRAKKRLWTERDGGELVSLCAVYDEQEEATTVCTEIERLSQSDGYSLSDFAVLYRTNAQSRAFEDVFLRRGMPYRLVGGMRFYERREIKDVLAYLRLISNPRDPVSFARIVNVPKRKIGDKTVAELEKRARRQRISPFEAVKFLDDADQMTPGALAALTAFERMVSELRELAGQVPLPELVERVVVDSGYRTMVCDGTPEGDERWSNVTELIGLAGEYALTPAPLGLQQFLENIALVSDVDSLEAVENKVTLITLHQVKGLEFPVVFMAGMEEGLLPHSRSLEDGDAGIEEERRLAYVGITRAQHRLYLMHAFRRHLYGTAQQTMPSRFLRDVPKELMRNQVVSSAPSSMSTLTGRVVPSPPVSRPVSMEQQFTAGMRVEHPKYGRGAILKSTMTRGGEEVVIRFDGAGVKMFALGDAKLTRIDA